MFRNSAKRRGSSEKGALSPVKPSGVPPPSAAKIKAIDMIMQEEEKERALARELERKAERTANAFQAKRQAEELLNAEAEKSIPIMPGRDANTIFPEATF